jgi:hypothetical protein
MQALPQKQAPTPAVRMQIRSIHSFLVYPGKKEENPHEINGATVSMTGLLFDMLRRVFDKAEEECQHDIAFTADDDAKQKNSCRDLLIGYIKDCDLPHGREVAKRFQSVTTHRSRLGLMFLMSDQHRGETKLVVSRFPADSGILAEEKEKGLSVEFLERIFMKSATSYKAAVYSGKSYAKDFWKGQAVDKQINSAESYISGCRSGNFKWTEVDMVECRQMTGFQDVEVHLDKTEPKSRGQTHQGDVGNAQFSPIEEEENEKEDRSGFTDLLDRGSGEPRLCFCSEEDEAKTLKK